MHQIENIEEVDNVCDSKYTSTETFDVVKPNHDIDLVNKASGIQYASAQIQTNGEFDPSMNEWTVGFGNECLAYPLKNLNTLQLHIGKEFSCNFDGSSSKSIQDIHVRVYSSREGEKSFVFIVGGDLMLLGKVKDWPESRCNFDDDEEEFNGDLEKLYQLLSLESRDNVHLVFTFAVFKDNIISSSQKNKGSTQDWKDTWESFE